MCRQAPPSGWDLVPLPSSKQRYCFISRWGCKLETWISCASLQGAQGSDGGELLKSSIWEQPQLQSQPGGSHLLSCNVKSMSSYKMCVTCCISSYPESCRAVHFFFPCCPVTAQNILSSPEGRGNEYMYIHSLRRVTFCWNLDLTPYPNPKCENRASSGRTEPSTS